MQRQLRVAEPMAQFSNLGTIEVVEMLPRTKKLNRGDPAALYFLQQRSRQPVLNEEVSGKNVIHESQ
jgi:hypothetical protein